jgi:hypothetical protein
MDSWRLPWNYCENCPESRGTFSITGAMVIAWTTEVTTGKLARLFDTTPKTHAMLATKGIIVSAGKGGM